ncbi:hypothetical protein J7E50_10330 [Pedobacter sp. ISL-68]|uniref:DUF5703 domain-containing protein n=1 Tax=unclassified Pedobacter TaxID=2628915 RepID=UPI001BEA5D80|nr:MULTISPECIES: DUF5703 domain-containing protein [unclassified Pedobacter]MBT2561227.1 hypothetical protein [Pedobacter sp. ISL-64]MBT2590616.1 hypothetical protein [Pedobacter sp. ISL-68]
MNHALSVLRCLSWSKRINLFFVLFSLSLCFLTSSAFSQEKASSNVVWNTQSLNSSASMPVGGGDIGLNLWVENGNVYLYLSKSSTFDENNTLLKLGRVKLKLSPNPFQGKSFKQELILKDGYAQISGSDGKLNAKINVWVDVFNPVIHLDIKSSQNVITEASYESWRFEDRITKGKENNQNSYKWAPRGIVKTFKDEIAFKNNTVQFYHQNKAETVFDITVKQQGLDDRKAELFNPLKNMIFGGTMQGDNLFPAGNNEGIYLSTPFKAWTLKSKKPSRSNHITIALHTVKTSSISDWEKQLTSLKINNNHKASIKWWNDYFEKSFIYINSKDESANQSAKNYQLFRYMLGCNAFGKYPTKFNGGLFTFDPQLTDTALKYTPDFRNWGGGTHTAQNQRLVYWPMLKSGDFEMMKPQFDFYLNLLKNAEIRTQSAWGHNGASFTEQLENFGLPNQAEYGWKRPADFNKGMEYNAWLEYQWDTVLEFCMMILETERYNGNNIEKYLPLIESSLAFFKEHYTYLAKQRGAKVLDADGHLVLYPGSGAETYKMAYNATSTIAALKTVLERLLEHPNLAEKQKSEWETMLKTIPPISFRTFYGRTTIAPAKLWERINNTESPQLYPVYPWGIYGIGKPGLDTAINTFKYDTDVLKFRSYIGWKQDNIFAARLGLTEDAAKLTTAKLKDSGRRFPAFWGPGFDWTPDHNWGGSGMIGLQEMLMQVDGKKIYLYPAWPKEWDVHFKLYAPYQTTVEGQLKNGKLIDLKVWPESRRADVINMIK